MVALLSVVARDQYLLSLWKAAEIRTNGRTNAYTRSDDDDRELVNGVWQVNRVRR
jgi:hypothetical protein